MFVSRERLIKKANEFRSSYIKTDVMCDAYKTEARNDRYNEYCAQMARSLDNLIAVFDLMDKEDIENYRMCIGGYYTVQNKKFCGDCITYAMDNGKVYVGWNRKDSRLNVMSVERAKERYEYVKDPNEKRGIKITVRVADVGIINGLVEIIKRKNGIR